MSEYRSAAEERSDQGLSEYRSAAEERSGQKVSPQARTSFATGCCQFVAA